MFKWILALFLFGLLYGLCHAAEVQVGAGTTVLRGPTEVVDVTLTEKAFGPTYWQQSVDYIGPSKFGVPVSLNYVGRGLLNLKLGLLAIGAGGSVMTNSAPYNGSRYNFNLQAVLRLSRFSVTYTHFSDAGLTKSNIGRDMVIFAVRI